MSKFIQAGTKLRCIDAIDSDFWCEQAGELKKLRQGEVYTAAKDIDASGHIEIKEMPGYGYRNNRFIVLDRPRQHSKQNTASFDVDAQNGFTPLCPDELPVPDGHFIVNALNAQALFANFRVGSKDAHSENADFVGTTWPRHCEVGTFGFELLDGLPKPDDYDYFVWKGVEKHLHPYGACYHNEDWQVRKKTTGVIEVLRNEAIKTVIVGGLATDYCVKNTALQLRDAGFEVILNLEACRGIAENTINEALDEMRSVGIIVVNTTAELSKYFE